MQFLTDLQRVPLEVFSFSANKTIQYPKTTDALRHTTVNLVSGENCPNNDGQICAMSAKALCVVGHYNKIEQSKQTLKIICLFQGDSGGGLYYNKTVIGIASYIKKDCPQGVTDTFINVYKFLGWIQDKMSIPDTTKNSILSGMIDRFIEAIVFYIDLVGCMLTRSC